MTKQVDIDYAQAHFSRLVHEAEQGEEVVITRAGKPIGKLVSFAAREGRVFGQDRGKICIPDDLRRAGRGDHRPVRR
jgi:prevent-host-death family protein